jgi:K+-transporting ATPase ATPase C chain
MRFSMVLVRQAWVGLLVLIGMTVVVGFVYPAVVWGVSRIGPGMAEGSKAHDRAGCVVGSQLLGIDPQVPAGQVDGYLHARVIGSSSPTDDPMAPGSADSSGGSQQGPSSEKLAGWIEQRREIIAKRENVSPAAVPVDAVTGSGSGLDPAISPAYARIQVPRIAAATHRTPQQVQSIIDANTDDRQWGFLGQQQVNVLKVNIALGHTAPGCTDQERK